MNLFTLSCVLIIVSNLSSAIVVLWKSQDRKLSIPWTMLCISAATWGFGAYHVSITRSEIEAFWWLKIAYFGVIFAPIFYFHFLYNFFILKNKFLLTLSYILGATFFLLNFFFPEEYFLQNLIFLFQQFYWHDWTANKSPFFLVFYAYFYLFLLPYSFFRLFKELSLSKGLRHNQIKYFIFGAFIGWIGAEFNFMCDFGIYIYPISNFLIGLYPFIIGYAMIRHQFLDINIVIKKSLVYTVLIALISLIYLIIVLALEKFLEYFFGYRSVLVSIGAAFGIGILFVPLRNRVQYFIDKNFFSGTLESLALEKQRLQQELFHKEKLAYVGQMASSIVHEIRNPLNTLETFIKYIPQKYNNPEFRQKLTLLLPAEIERMKKVLERLLEMAKPSHLNPESVNICELIDRTLELLKDRLELKKIIVKKEYGSAQIIAPVDSDLIKQVFLNLFLNAVHALDEEGILTIGVKSSGAIIDIGINDNGPGIPSEIQKKLFTPFFTTKKDGIGLGLVITKEIIEEHGGSINVESTPGAGTTFTIQLPAGRPV